jgi:hypothetical protein
MLQLSSCLFSTIVLHAYYLRCEDYHHLFLGLTVTSLLFHTTGGEQIRIADKALAHLCFVRNLFDMKPAIARGQGWLLLFPIGVASLWFGQGLFHPRARRAIGCTLRCTFYLWWDCTYTCKPSTHDIIINSHKILL